MKSFGMEIYEEIISQAKENGYTIYTVKTPGAKTFGQTRVGGSKIIAAPDRRMNSVNVALWNIQSRVEQ